MGRVSGKVALITGGARGLGAADARALVREGAMVVIADVLEDEGRALAAELGDAASFMSLDVRDEAAWDRVIDAIRARHGRLDVLVNNAGVTRFGDPESVKTDDYRFIMAVSVDGTVFGTRAALPLMKESGGGSIINMASIASVQGEAYVAAYCAAKGAVEAYTRATAVHCAQKKLNIRCNSLHPAAIDTPMVRSAPALAAAANMPEVLSGEQASLANPVGEPTDIAHLVVYLASDESRFISGQRFIIDSTSSVTTGAVPGNGWTAATL